MGSGDGVGDSDGGGGAVLGSDGGGVAVPGSDGGGVAVLGSDGGGVPAVVVSLGDPPGGWLDGGVGVSDRVLVGDSASQIDGVGVAAADAECGDPDRAEWGTSWAPPATTCVPSSDTGTAQPRDVLEGLPASGA